MPMVGFIWAGILAFIYWFIKKIFYYVAFDQKILSVKKNGF